MVGSSQSWPSQGTSTRPSKPTTRVDDAPCEETRKDGVEGEAPARRKVRKRRPPGEPEKDGVEVRSVRSVPWLPPARR